MLRNSGIYNSPLIDTPITVFNHSILIKVSLNYAVKLVAADLLSVGIAAHQPKHVQQIRASPKLKAELLDFGYWYPLTGALRGKRLKIKWGRALTASRYRSYVG